MHCSELQLVVVVVCVWHKLEFFESRLAWQHVCVSSVVACFHFEHYVRVAFLFVREHVDVRLDAANWECYLCSDNFPFSCADDVLINVLCERVHLVSVRCVGFICELCEFVVDARSDFC